jgi:hypothetical protein
LVLIDIAMKITPVEKLLSFSGYTAGGGSVGLSPPVRHSNAVSVPFSASLGGRRRTLEK